MSLRFLTSKFKVILRKSRAAFARIELSEVLTNIVPVENPPGNFPSSDCCSLANPQRTDPGRL
jgi:hypothetical protein